MTASDDLGTSNTFTGVEERSTVRLSARTNAYDIHRYLRAEIVSGRLRPGTILAQAKLAREIGVSRTPVREAMRMLESEGLLLAEPNNRMLVSAFSVEDLDGIYAARIALESLGVSLSVSQMTGADIEEMEQSVDQMSAESCWLDFDSFVAEHRRFHNLLVRHCAQALRAEIASLAERSTRFQYLHARNQDIDHWQDDVARHVQLIAACRSRDGNWAARLTARHLAEKALALFEAHEGETEQCGRAVRAALAMVMAAHRKDSIRNKPRQTGLKAK